MTITFTHIRSEIQNAGLLTCNPFYFVVNEVKLMSKDKFTFKYNFIFIFVLKLLKMCSIFV